MDRIELYGSYLSQPTRTIAFFLNYLKLEFKFILIDFEKNLEILSEINPQEKMPTLKYKNEIIYESTSIIRFISKYVKNDLYPIDDKKTILKIEEYFQIHHRVIRKLSALLYLKIFRLENFKDILKLCKENTEKILNYIENSLLKENYLINDKLTICDIYLANEIIQLNMLNHDFSKFPKIMNFLKKINSNGNFKEYLTANLKIMKKNKIKSYI